MSEATREPAPEACESANQRPSPELERCAAELYMLLVKEGYTSATIGEAIRSRTSCDLLVHTNRDVAGSTLVVPRVGEDGADLVGSARFDAIISGVDRVTILGHGGAL